MSIVVSEVDESPEFNRLHYYLHSATGNLAETEMEHAIHGPFSRPHVGKMAYRQMKKRQKRRHRWWVHAILEKRRQYGTYHHLVQELQLDGEMFQQYFRLSQEQFSQVLFLIGDTLIKDNRIRDVISPRERLAVCLR
ncbi:hypothetical protein ACOMHN_055999 [Nucella lapillus]